MYFYVEYEALDRVRSAFQIFSGQQISLYWFLSLCDVEGQNRIFYPDLLFSFHMRERKREAIISLSLSLWNRPLSPPFLFSF